jgi:hypothetical protein
LRHSRSAARRHHSAAAAGAGSIVGWLKLRSGTRSMPVAQAAGLFGIVLT